MSNLLEASYIGKMDYEQAELLQQDLARVVKNKGIHAVIGLEHPAVITLGYRAMADQIASETKTALVHDIPWVQSTRGGLATLHSEGQLVIYPIINLRERGWGVKAYVHHLLAATKDLLSELEIESFMDEQAIGLYTAQGKIAFCGIQVKNGVSLHGISLNVRNDLTLFQNIQACGIQGAALDRVQNYNVNLTLSEIFSRWLLHFRSRLT